MLEERQLKLLRAKGILLMCLPVLVFLKKIYKNYLSSVFNKIQKPARDALAGFREREKFKKTTWLGIVSGVVFCQQFVSAKSTSQQLGFSLATLLRTAASLVPDLGRGSLLSDPSCHKLPNLQFGWLLPRNGRLLSPGTGWGKLAGLKVQLLLPVLSLS